LSERSPESDISLEFALDLSSLGHHAQRTKPEPQQFIGSSRSANFVIPESAGMIRLALCKRTLMKPKELSAK
jgi:hypothetical protein